MHITESEIDAIYQTVAEESFKSVNAFAKEYEATEPELYQYSGPYLYVFSNGQWSIDYPDSIATTNHCVSCIPVCVYPSVESLKEDIMRCEDWDVWESEMEE